MDSSNEDLELIAAFIDGRLSGAERARAMRLLADSDEALEIFTIASQQRNVTAGTVVPIERARGFRRWRVIVPLAAAAALAVVMVPRFAGNGARPVLANDYALDLARDPRFASGLPAGWEQRSWSVTRGGTSPAGTERPNSPLESKLAFRLGVRSVDLQIALRHGDTAMAGRITNELIETLKGVGFSEAVAASYTELRSNLATEPAPRSIDRASGAERELSNLLGSSSFAFGQWVGAADLAAQMHDASFFESDHGTGFIRSAVPEGGLTADDVEALKSIEARLASGRDDRALDEVHAILQTIIRRRGG